MEVAGASEQSRGLAVVAGEVRSLVNNAGQAMTNVVGQFDDVTQQNAALIQQST